MISVKSGFIQPTSQPFPNFATGSPITGWAPGALLGSALSEAIDHVLKPLGQGFVPKGVIHRPKPFAQMTAIHATEACCLGFSDRAGQRWYDPV
jgi:hypothetical protein